MSRVQAQQGSPEIIDLCKSSSSEELGPAGQKGKHRRHEPEDVEIIDLISQSSNGPTAAGSGALLSNADSRPGPSQQQQGQPEPLAEPQASAPVGSGALPSASNSSRPHSPQHGQQQEASGPSSPRGSSLPSATTSGSSQSVGSMGRHTAALLRCDVEPAAFPDLPQPPLPGPSLLAAGNCQGIPSRACPSPARAPQQQQPLEEQLAGEQQQPLEEQLAGEQQQPLEGQLAGKQQQQPEDEEQPSQQQQRGQQLGSSLPTSPLRAGGAAVTILPQSPVADAALADLQRLASQPVSPSCRVLPLLDEGPGTLDTSWPKYTALLARVFGLPSSEDAEAPTEQLPAPAGLGDASAEQPRPPAATAAGASAAAAAAAAPTEAQPAVGPPLAPLQGSPAQPVPSAATRTPGTASKQRQERVEACADDMQRLLRAHFGGQANLEAVPDLSSPVGLYLMHPEFERLQQCSCEQEALRVMKEEELPEQLLYEFALDESGEELDEEEEEEEEEELAGAQAAPLELGPAGGAAQAAAAQAAAEPPAAEQLAVVADAAEPPAAEKPAVVADVEMADADILGAVDAGVGLSCQLPSALGAQPAPSPAWDPGQPSTSAAAVTAGAVSGAGAAPGPAAPPSPPLPHQQEQQQQQHVGEGEPPDPSDTAAMLRYLRSKIPAQLLAQYPGQQVVRAEDKAEADKRLELYNTILEHHKATGVGKPKYDMKSIRHLKVDKSDWPVWTPSFGHPPGIEVGQQFGGRCELAAAGVHHRFMHGIAHSAGQPACAVVASGGYEDDTDHGDWLIYTGMGGRSNDKRQAVDQTWTEGNLALLQAHQQNKPVRVARGSSSESEDGTKGKMQYSYDGLYCIVDAREETSAGGAKVCKFWMVGIPGHYNTAARRVTFLALRGFQTMRLAVEQPERPTSSETSAAAAAAAGPARPPKMKGTKRGADREPKQGRGKQRAASPPPSPLAAAPALPPPHTRPGFLIDDVSGGLEANKIPVFNEVDDEPAPTNIFTYIRTSVVPGQAARELMMKGQALMPDGGQWCGIKQHNNKLPYTNTGLMKETESLGLWECCSGCTGRRCQLNRVATSGIRLPVEVFRVSPYKGWGVRCPVDIAAGSLICTYEGEIVTSEEGERGEDNYLFDLDHFIQLHSDRTVFGRARAKLLPLPGDLNMEEHEHLVIDALRYGNVARFINHSCEPNLVVQPILAEGCSALRYLVAIVAARNIPAHTEISYDYNYALLNGRQLHCSCGAVKCRGRLH